MIAERLLLTREIILFVRSKKQKKGYQLVKRFSLASNSHYPGCWLLAVGCEKKASIPRVYLLRDVSFKGRIPSTLCASMILHHKGYKVKKRTIVEGILPFFVFVFVFDKDNH